MLRHTGDEKKSKQLPNSYCFKSVFLSLINIKPLQFHFQVEPGVIKCDMF